MTCIYELSPCIRPYDRPCYKCVSQHLSLEIYLELHVIECYMATPTYKAPAQSNQTDMGLPK